MGVLTLTFFIVSLLGLSAWIGEVVTLNFVIVPSIKTMDEAGKASFIAKYFPRFFRMATILALTTVLAGLAAWITGGYPSDVQGSILKSPPTLLVIASILVLILTTFHLVVESRLRPMAKSLEQSLDPDKIKFMSKFLNIVPRVGFSIIVSSYTMILISLLSLR